MPFLGVPRLQHLCITLLVNFRDCLGILRDVDHCGTLPAMYLTCFTLQRTSVIRHLSFSSLSCCSAMQSSWQASKMAQGEDYCYQFNACACNTSTACQTALCLSIGMEEGKCTMHCSHTGIQYSRLTSQAGSTHLFRFVDPLQQIAKAGYKGHSNLCHEFAALT